MAMEAKNPRKIHRRQQVDDTPDKYFRNRIRPAYIL